MRQQKFNDNFMIGFMIGATIPILGYFVINTVFEALTQSGIMDEVTSSTITKRMKTLSLLGICCNLLPAQIASNRRYVQILKGIILATLIYAGFWAGHFYLALF